MSNEKRWLDELAKIEKLCFELGAEMEYHGGFGVCGDTGRLLLILSRDVKYISERVKQQNIDDTKENGAS